MGEHARNIGEMSKEYEGMWWKMGENMRRMLEEYMGMRRNTGGI